MAAGQAINRRRTYWITGASSGIGLELATQLARSGNYVVASGRNRQQLLTLQTRFPKLVQVIGIHLIERGPS